MHEPLSVLGEMRSRKHARLAIVRLVDSGAHPVAAPLPSQPWPGVDFVRAYLRDSTLAPRPRVRADACQHDATGLPPWPSSQLLIAPPSTSATELPANR